MKLDAVREDVCTPDELREKLDGIVEKYSDKDHILRAKVVNGIARVASSNEDYQNKDNNGYSVSVSVKGESFVDKNRIPYKIHALRRNICSNSDHFSVQFKTPDGITWRPQFRIFFNRFPMWQTGTFPTVEQIDQRTPEGVLKTFFQIYGTPAGLFFGIPDPVEQNNYTKNPLKKIKLMKEIHDVFRRGGVCYNQIMKDLKERGSRELFEVAANADIYADKK